MLQFPCGRKFNLPSLDLLDFGASLSWHSVFWSRGHVHILLGGGVSLRNTLGLRGDNKPW